MTVLPRVLVVSMLTVGAVAGAASQPPGRPAASPVEQSVSHGADHQDYVCASREAARAGRR